jgi:hypothetical protein
VTAKAVEIANLRSVADNRGATFNLFKALCSDLEEAKQQSMNREIKENE